MFRTYLWAAALAAAVTAPALAHDASTEEGKVTIVYDQKLPNVPGKSMKGVLVEYEPGGSSPAHTHPRSSFLYATVLEGAIRSQVNGGPIKIYHAGENFSEFPGDHHGVSQNASKTKPARLLAVFVVDTDEKNLTTLSNRCPAQCRASCPVDLPPAGHDVFVDLVAMHPSRMIFGYEDL